MKKSKVAMLAFLSLLPCAAGAQVFTLADLARECATYEAKDVSAEKEFEIGHSAGLCDGFILGLAQGYSYYGLSEKKEHNLFCLPPNITNAEIAKSVVTWVQMHNEVANQGAATIAMMLRQKYPCKKPQ
ncbi:MAG: hypothetical protein J0L97_10775 [Alphaproteobacteria bacterium]|nr:hypothetical protein [Alphaproteobacteria bacterium]